MKTTSEHAVRSLEEVAEIMRQRTGKTFSKQAVRWFEQSAFKKLRRIEAVHEMYREVCCDSHT